MFSDIGPLEVVALAVLAVILVGPDKLPKLVADTARTLRRLREFSRSAQEGIREELPAELRDLSLQDLDPKTFVTKNLLGDRGLGLGDLASGLDFEGPPPHGGGAAKISKSPGTPAASGAVPANAGHPPRQPAGAGHPDGHQGPGDGGP
ncbi:Sec-independent protein translocase TatB [Streptomyces sp. NPDC026673]|uniref:Sec-independent protein translocase TatB n=1 Tax=Streptomyces sp. NPDC026673 TaxID=3155724 RepID=UPI0033FFA4D7